MKFKKYLEEDAAQLAVPGMATRSPHVWGSGNPDSFAGKKCPPDTVWNEAKGKCEKGLPSDEVRFYGARPAKSRITSRTSEDYMIEKMGMEGASLKINKVEVASQKLFTFLIDLVDEIEKEVMEKEGRKVQIQSQKVKIKAVERDLHNITENLKRFAKRV